jgi:hypothetical protein
MAHARAAAPWGRRAPKRLGSFPTSSSFESLFYLREHERQPTGNDRSSLLNPARCG